MPPKVGGKLTKLENASGDEFYTYMTIDEFLQMYKPYENNRGGKVNMARVHEIAYSLAHGNTRYLLEAISVDWNTNTTFEGHNRLLAAKELKEKYGITIELPVRVVKLPKGVKVGEAAANSNACKLLWTLSMRIEQLIAEGNKDYKRLKDLAETLGGPFVDDKGNVRWRYTAALKGKSQQTELKAGTFSLSEKEAEEMLEIGHQIYMFWADADKPKIGPWFEAFIVAWCSRVANTKQAIVELMYNKVSKAIIKGDFVFDGSNQVTTWCTRFTEAIMGEHLISITGEPIIPGKRAVND